MEINEDIDNIGLPRCESLAEAGHHDDAVAPLQLQDICAQQTLHALMLRHSVYNGWSPVEDFTTMAGTTTTTPDTCLSYNTALLMPVQSGIRCY